MTTINPNQGSFKQVEGDSWMSLYLPAICAGVLMLGVMLLAVSCSKKSNNAAKIVPPTPPAASSPAPTTQAAAAPETPKEKVHKHYRPANVRYVNSEYGVSFSYPRKYSLQSGDKLGGPSIPTFLKPGAVQVVTVDVPDSFYPETDFASAVLNAKMNKDMTAEECGQFVLASQDSTDVKPTTVKLGGNEFTEFEQITGEGGLKSDLKYFHLFKNNACYEFVLDVDTVATKDSDLAQVDRSKVFHTLERILTTARIKDVQPAQVEDAAKAPAAAEPTDQAKMATDKPAGSNIAETKTMETKTMETKTVDAASTDSKTSDTKPMDDTEKAQIVPPQK